MGKFRHMVSVELTKDEKQAERDRWSFPTPVDDMPDTPPGLCISLTEVELEKLGLSDDCEVGDTIHVFGMAKVTSISKNDTGNGCRCRIELAFVEMEVEDEDEENEEEDDDD